MHSSFVSFVDVARCPTKEESHKQLMVWRLGIMLKFDAIAASDEETSSLMPQGQEQKSHAWQSSAVVGSDKWQWLLSFAEAPSSIGVRWLANETTRHQKHNWRSPMTYIIDDT
jgi:hypothetical protein